MKSYLPKSAKFSGERALRCPNSPMHGALSTSSIAKSSGRRPKCFSSQAQPARREGSRSTGPQLDLKACYLSKTCQRGIFSTLMRHLAGLLLLLALAWCFHHQVPCVGVIGNLGNQV